MKKLGGIQLKAILILSVVAPIGLLVTFRLTGILEEAPTPVTIKVETARWNMIRPSHHIPVRESIGNFYVDQVTSINLTISISDYLENAGSWAGFDVVWSMVLVNMSVGEGFVESLFVDFTELDEYAALDIHGDMDRVEAVNLEVAKIVDWDWVFGRSAYIKTTGTNQPKNVYLQFLFAWMFKDPNNTSHQLTVTLEAAYFNGSTHQEIRIPIQMKVFQS